MATVSTTDIQQINSTTYVDLLGVLLGLERIIGESSDEYIERLYQATRLSRGHEYVGALNEVNLQLNLDLKRAISLSGSTDTNVTVAIDGITLSNTTETVSAGLLTLDPDDAWTWRLLSDIVTDLNKKSSTVTATLLIADAPTLVLAKQSNKISVIAEEISGQSVNLEKTGIVSGSVAFNNSISGYTLDADNGFIHFNSPVPSGTQISYDYQVWPYSLVSSEGAIIGMSEPSLANVAEGPNGKLVYQIREVVQSIMKADRSYWKK